MKHWLTTWQEWMVVIVGSITATWGLLLLMPKMLRVLRRLFAKLAYVVEISDTLARMEEASEDRHVVLLDMMNELFQTRRIHLDAEQEIAYFDSDARGNQEWANAHWHRMTGLTHDEARGRGWENALAEEHRHRVLADWTQALDHQRAYVGVVIYVNRLGVKTVMNVHATPVRNHKREISGYRGVCTPV